MIRALLILLGVIGILDTYIISGYASMHMGVILPLILGVPLLILGVFYTPITYYFNNFGFGKFLKFGMIAAYSLFTLLFCVCATLMLISGNKKSKPHADVLIVLGCGIRGERVSLTLAHRLNTAYDYLIDNPNTAVIVSGGQGDDEHISEALAMKRYLAARGIDEHRIIMEDKSTRSIENFAFSKEIIDERFNKDASVVFVSTRFHVFRAERLAKSVGINAHGIGAPGVWFLAPNDYLREMCSITFYTLKGLL